jgi:Na+/phosphate symporter
MAWAQRALSEPRLGIAVLIGAIVGTPGAAYIAALHQLVTGTSATASQAVAVVLFCLIEFSLVIVPFIFLQLRPRGTEAKLRSIQSWLMSHARQLVAAAAILAGSYMTISGLARLLS